MATSEIIQVHSYGNQVSAAVDCTKWTMMSDASVIWFRREIEMDIVNF